MKKTVFYIVAFTFYSFIGYGQPIIAEASEFAKKLRHDINNKKYTWVNDKKEIPDSIYTFIILWEKENQKERERYEFDITNPEEEYNAGCYILRHLTFRRLLLAGYHGKEWIIVYEHGQGKVNNTKLLHLDIQNSNNLSFFYVEKPILKSFTIAKKVKIFQQYVNEKYLCLFRSSDELCELSSIF